MKFHRSAVKDHPLPVTGSEKSSTNLTALEILPACPDFASSQDAGSYSEANVFGLDSFLERGMDKRTKAFFKEYLKNSRFSRYKGGEP